MCESLLTLIHNTLDRELQIASTTCKILGALPIYRERKMLQ